MPVTQQQLDAVFDRIVQAAVNGERCPQTGHDGFTSAITTALARAGRILIEVYARNWRVVEILTGPHKGKRTMACPHNRSAAPHIVVGRETYQGGSRQHRSSGQQPSAPRALSAEELRKI